MQGTSKSRLLEEFALEDLKTKRSIHKLVLYFKIVNNFTLNYLSNLLPQTLQQRSGLVLRHALNFLYFLSELKDLKAPSFRQQLCYGTVLIMLNVVLYQLVSLNSILIAFLIFLITTSFWIIQLTDILLFYIFVFHYSLDGQEQVHLPCTSLINPIHSHQEQVDETMAYWL